MTSNSPPNTHLNKPHILPTQVLETHRVNARKKLKVSLNIDTLNDTECRISPDGLPRVTTPVLNRSTTQGTTQYYGQLTPFGPVDRFVTNEDVMADLPTSASTASFLHPFRNYSPGINYDPIRGSHRPLRYYISDNAQINEFQGNGHMNANLQRNAHMNIQSNSDFQRNNIQVNRPRENYGQLVNLADRRPLILTPLNVPSLKESIHSQKDDNKVNILNPRQLPTSREIGPIVLSSRYLKCGVHCCSVNTGGDGRML